MLSQWEENVDGCSSGLREMESSRAWMDEFLMFKITFFFQDNILFGE